MVSQHRAESKPGKDNGFKGTEHKLERWYFQTNILKHVVTLIYLKQIPKFNIQPITRVEMSLEYRNITQTIVNNVSGKEFCI